MADAGVPHVVAVEAEKEVPGVTEILQQLDDARRNDYLYHIASFPGSTFLIKALEEMSERQKID